MITHAYDHWVFYSKYEHIGWSSFNLTRIIDQPKYEKRLRYVLKLALMQVGMCCNVVTNGAAHEEASRKVNALNAFF